MCTSTIYFWCVLLLYTSDVHFWYILLMCTSTIYFWCVLLIYTSNVYFWYIVLMCTSDIFFWCVLLSYLSAPSEAPPNVTGYRKNSSAAQLCWGALQFSAPYGVYRIKVSATAPCAHTVSKDVPLDSTSAEVSGLTPSVSYEVLVAGMVGNKIGPFSEPIIVGAEAEGRYWTTVGIVGVLNSEIIRPLYQRISRRLHNPLLT